MNGLKYHISDRPGLLRESSLGSATLTCEILRLIVLIDQHLSEHVHHLIVGHALFTKSRYPRVADASPFSKADLTVPEVSPSVALGVDGFSAC